MSEILEGGHVRGTMIWSRAEWVENMERSTYFLVILEKHKYCNELITKLNVDDI